MEEFRYILRSTRVFKPSDIAEVIGMAFAPDQVAQVASSKLRYYSAPCAFDIETSSFYAGPDKRACMYLWSMCLNGYVIIGRTWNEAVSCFDALSKGLGLGKHLRLIIYVHNLGYEFQFLRKWLKWSKVFAMDARKPVYAITDGSIEFRCSYLLSGYGLASLGKQLQRYKVEKLVGNLDYSLMRHSGTFLTGKEIAYSVNDVKVVAAYVQECIEVEGDITRIPITKTGYVRRYCRNICYYSKGVPRKKSFKRLKYMDLMADLTLEPDEYKQLKRAFQGGFTHANALYSGATLDHVCSYDFTSSYPAVMVAEQFPMSRSERYDPKSKADFERCLRLYCCLFDVRITGLRPKLGHETYISMSRCWGVKTPVLNNGRIAYAEELYTTITEQDWLIINQYYYYDSVAVSNFRRYRKAYLPKDFVIAILTLYGDKTTLKGVEGSEAEYMLKKSMCNSAYGMTVTDIVRPEIGYEDDWTVDLPDIVRSIDAYNRNKGRFLYYPWGVWVTAYARRNLFAGITEYGDDYVYSDTDSVKGLNPERHQAFIYEYNARITDQMDAAMDYHGLPRELTRPKTIKGIEKPLGVWDREPDYQRFKTLGAKRYMTEQDDEISITVSGLNKRVTAPYLARSGNDAAFDAFRDDLYIPPEYTGKNTHTYIDDECSGMLVDYLGIPGNYYERSFVHLEAADYTLSLAQEYIDYILQVKEYEQI